MLACKNKVLLFLLLDNEMKVLKQITIKDRLFLSVKIFNLSILSSANIN